MTQWGLDNLFNPGKRHMDDEKRRLQSTREEVGDSSGGRRIDLDGGKVSISLTGSSAAAGRSTENEGVDDAAELAASLEVGDVPAVALAGGDVDIEPVVSEHSEGPKPARNETPSSDSTPELTQSTSPRPHLSANAWSRRG